MPREQKSLLRSLLAPPSDKVARTGFWLGVFWLVVSLLTTFEPASGALFYAVSAFFLAGGLYLPQRPYRRAAAVLMACCAVIALASSLHTAS